MSGPMTINTSPLEINLMRQETRRTSGGLPLLVPAVFLAGSALVGWLWTDANGRAGELQAELDAVNAKIAEFEALQAQAASSLPVQSWAVLPDALRAAKPEATAVLDGLKELLPEEANAASVTYSDDGRLNVSARFASVEHVISFMRAVRESENFELLNMSGLTNSLPDSGGGPEQPDDAPDAAGQPQSDIRTMPVVSGTFDLRYIRSEPDQEGAGP